ncbi:MAG TPA: helix-turn-helix domain-containing protein [Ktedonobacteraceae bacterium]|nr:helix-turn-helix domain-containing protein [Ktedonobacteraceae bacterium]
MAQRTSHLAISASMIGQDNEMKDLTLSTLEKIAKALKVDILELIEALPDE